MFNPQEIIENNKELKKELENILTEKEKNISMLINEKPRKKFLCDFCACPTENSWSVSTFKKVNGKLKEINVPMTMKEIRENEYDLFCPRCKNFWDRVGKKSFDAWVKSEKERIKLEEEKELVRNE